MTTKEIMFTTDPELIAESLTDSAERLELARTIAESNKIMLEILTLGVEDDAWLDDDMADWS